MYPITRDTRTTSHHKIMEVINDFWPEQVVQIVSRAHKAMRKFSNYLYTVLICMELVGLYIFQIHELDNQNN